MEVFGNQLFQRLSIGKVARNTLTFLPDDFNDTNDRQYPLLLVHPGSGEVSTQGGVAALLKNGINKMLADGWKPYTKIPTPQKFIVFTVQQDSTGYALTPEQMFTALRNNELIAGRYRNDAVFVTGLSLGACATCYFFENIYAREYLPLVAGLIPMSGVKLSVQNYDFEFIKQHPKPVWAFCGRNDTISRRSFMEDLIEEIPGIEYTWYNAGHSGWIAEYRDARSSKGFSPLEWCASLIPEKIPVAKVITRAGQLDSIIYDGPPIVRTTNLEIYDADTDRYIASILYRIK